MLTKKAISAGAFGRQTSYEKREERKQREKEATSVAGQKIAAASSWEQNLWTQRRKV